MTVHIPAARQEDILLDGCTLICIWNIWEPSRPQKVLIYQSEVNSTTINMNISFEIRSFLVQNPLKGTVAAGSVLLLQPWKGHISVCRHLSGLCGAVGPEGIRQ